MIVWLLFQNSIPFAVVSSNTVVEAGGKKIRGRMYPWGIVEGKHCITTFLLFNSTVSKKNSSYCDH